MTASQLVDKYITFFEKRGHKRVQNSPLIPENDPTTLFTSSGMQPLVPYLLGEPHPEGKRLVNVQNCFRAQDIDEIGDNRHTTFFRMLGNWSLGGYFKKEQLSWMFEFLTKNLGISPKKLYVSVFDGLGDIPKDDESAAVWQDIFENIGINPKERIFYYSSKKNWWSRAGLPENMPVGEPGGPSSEIFYDFGTSHDPKFGDKCHLNCDCGRFFELSNNVFMLYQKQKDGSFKELPKKNVDHGAGLERFLAAVERKKDVFQTSLFAPIILSIEKVTGKNYKDHQKEMRIVTDHFIAACSIALNFVVPSNKEQGYLLRRLIRRGLDNFYLLEGNNLLPVIETIAAQYKDTDQELVLSFEKIKGVLLEEEQIYGKATSTAKKYIEQKYKGKKIGDELMGTTEISASDAFLLYATHGLSPTQIRSLGFVFDEREFSEKMKKHQDLSRKGAGSKFAGGLADHQKHTIMGHTATHLLHQALRDVLGKSVYQTGSNITSERIRFDFSYDKKPTADEVKKVEEIVNQKIKENLPVHFEMMSTAEAKKTGAIGLFDEKYGETVKVYFVSDYSIEFCGGPHVDSTGTLKNFKITKEEGLGRGMRRIYCVVGSN